MPRQEALPSEARFLTDDFGGFCLLIVAGRLGRQAFKKLACKLPVGGVAAGIAGEIIRRIRLRSLPALEGRDRQNAKRKHVRLHLSQSLISLWASDRGRALPCPAIVQSRRDRRCEPARSRR